MKQRRTGETGWKWRHSPQHPDPSVIRDRVNKLFTYLENYGLLSLEKQDKLADVIGEHTYEIDLDDGTIRFDSAEFPFQVLGTESDNTLTWLWAWAEEQTEIQENLITTSRTLRDWGEKEDLPELFTPSVDLGLVDGLAFALIASEVCKASCFYHDVYEGGSLFILLFDNRIDSQPSCNLTRLSKQFLNLISLYELNHKNALLSYLNAKGLSPVSEGAQITCKLETGELLNAEFDVAGGLTSLNGEAIKV
jgi:Family of unknown function (DUF6882)